MQILANQPLQHLEHPRNDFVYVEYLEGNHLHAGKGQDLAREIRGAIDGTPYFLQVGMERLSRINLVQGYFGMPDDYPQHVVEIMGYSSGQSPD